MTSWRPGGPARGFIFQNYNLVPVLNAYENIELPLLLSNLSRSQRRERVMEAPPLWSPGGRMWNYPRQLSGGQEQRVAVARAFVGDPTSSWRTSPRRPGRQETPRRSWPHGAPQPGLGKTILMVTHDPRPPTTPFQIHLEKGVLDRTVEVNR